MKAFYAINEFISSAVRRCKNKCAVTAKITVNGELMRKIFTSLMYENILLLTLVLV